MWFITYANGIAWHVISLQNLKTKYLGLGSVVYADVHLCGCKLYLEFGWLQYLSYCKRGHEYGIN